MPSETKRRTVRPVSTLQVHVLRGPWHAAGRDLPDRSMSTLPCGWHPYILALGGRRGAARQLYTMFRERSGDSRKY